MISGITTDCRKSSKDEELKKELLNDDLKFDREIRARARASFKFFFNTIWSLSIREVDGKFVSGKWFDSYCDRLQFKLKTCTLAARKHGKTTVVLGFLAWLIFRADIMDKYLTEYLFIMFSDDLAGEKIKLCKMYIQANPYFSHIKDLKPNAETTLDYLNNEKLILIKPAGIFSAIRSKHPDGVICDDILRDPQKALDIIQIEKVTQIFEAVISALAKEGGFTHVVGTSQDESDIMHKLEKKEGWDCVTKPAIIDRNKKILLWPEMYSFERMIDIELNETGKKNFQKEYQLLPVRLADGFFTRGEIESKIDKELINYNNLTREREEYEFGICYAGFDIGKKRHPSHLAVFELIEEIKIAWLIQVCSLWLDEYEYQEQVRVLNKAIRKFKIGTLYFDNTRSEIESYIENGELESEAIPFVMTSTSQDKIAGNIDKVINTNDESKVKIILLNDDRQTKSLISVDGNLKAVSTPEGHGDAFWSIGLGVQAYFDNASTMIL
jgi:hypothetical protein